MKKYIKKNGGAIIAIALLLTIFQSNSLEGSTLPQLAGSFIGFFLGSLIVAIIIVQAYRLIEWAFSGHNKEPSAQKNIESEEEYVEEEILEEEPVQEQVIEEEIIIKPKRKIQFSPYFIRYLKVCTLLVVILYLYTAFSLWSWDFSILERNYGAYPSLRRQLGIIYIVGISITCISVFVYNKFRPYRNK